MAKRFELLVFDWDGTVLDSTRAIVQAMQAACRDLGLPEPDEQCARQVIGLGLGDALRLVAPGLSVDCYPQMSDRYRHHYLSCDRSLNLFEGIPALMAELHAQGFCLAVATGKGRRGLNRALGDSGLGHFFSSTRCADECFSKPHPQMLEELMDEFDVLPSRTLMIGDTTHDLQMAINAQVTGLAVSYGAHTVDSLQSLDPVACLGSVDQLRQWLASNS